MRLRVADGLVGRSTALLSVVGLCSSCEQVPLLAPTASTVTIAASRSVLPVNASAQVTATVIELGGTAVHDGTLVTFATTLGALEPREAFTQNGQAVVTLRAGAQSGVAEVSAFSGGARSESPVRIAIGAAAAASVTLTASPGTVPAAGGVVTLSARPADAGGNALAGVAVAFSADAGTLGASTVVSDAHGEARNTLTTDRDATVTASAGGHAAAVTVRVNAAPAVTIAATGPPPAVGEPTAFTVTAAAGSSAIRDVTVDFGDGASRSLGALVGSTNVTHTYRTAGTFQVAATATDTSGEAASVATVIAVQGAVPLNVTVAAAPAAPRVGAPVTFTATVTQPTGTPAIDRYAWTFGDGRRAVTAGNATSHAYDRAGRRVVTVRAAEQDGRTGEARIEIDVSPRPPLNVNLTADPLRAAVDDVVVFTAAVSGSTTPIARYAWHFGDGTRVTTTGNVVNHVYDRAATREAEVRVEDQDGQTGVGRTTIEVTPRAPLNVNLTANPTRAAVDDVVVFTAAVGGSTTPIARYAWHFGDGTRVTTTGNVVNHVYDRAATREAEVRVEDQDGQTGVGRTTIEVTPRAPLNVNLTANPTRTVAGGVVVFTATVTGSTAPIARYEWRFGDGARATTTGNVVDHVYTKAGVRTAGVTVVSAGNDRGTSQATVVVAPPRLEVTLAIDPLVAAAGQRVTFTVTVSPETAAIVRYEWDFGDAGENTATTTGRTTRFAYGADDRGETRTVTVTAVAFDGAEVSTEGLVSIRP